MKINIVLFIIFILTITANQLFAHCDGIDGPVVKAAKKSLTEYNINYTLVWIKPEFEQEVRDVFDKVKSVRNNDEVTKEIADYYFFETVVRLHREGEGEPYTGLKSEGTEVNPGIKYADLALENGSVQELKSILVNSVSESIENKYHLVFQSKNYDYNNVKLGREFVEAYVQYIHFAEKIYELSQSAHHHEGR